jgi:hypothetical protein
MATLRLGRVSQDKRLDLLLESVNCVNGHGKKKIGDPMAIDKKLVDQVLANCEKPEDIIGENGLLKELTKAILERALEAEMTDHLGYEKHDPVGRFNGQRENEVDSPLD